ncbi:phosphoribosylglycinamide formyltransferase [Tissierella sp.]|uniref:phosphoribosylglycinamide formyltransferase n=1 Tax=Tissierella sp. TaxID=41274 RepID=UPI0028614621|nr:phosphoribosylglycinamide formyltransferase [Tissierella sp.]MDR7856709.1 phosphoribosylglycinamide formyltransferase [Tissierella sp.]
MLNIGVLISGGGTNLQAIIDNIESGNINGEIKLIISNRKEAYGLTRGANAGIDSLFLDRKSFHSEEEYNLELIKLFKARDIELIILAGYLKVLSKKFIQEFSGRIINVHPSLIPSFSGKGYYGDKVHQAVLDYGVKITGATVHFVDEGTDTGPIILQDIVCIDSKDTALSLKEKVLDVEHKLLVQAVKLYCDKRISLDGRKVITY